LPRRVLARVQRGCDLGVVEVIAVAEHDGGTLLRRQLAGQLGELRIGGLGIGRAGLGELVGVLAAAVLVDRDPACDRQNPGTQVRSVLEAWVGPERTKEGLLERVLGTRAAEPLREEAEDLVAVLGIEVFEGRDRCHGVHLGGKRGRASRCETSGMHTAVVGHLEWVEFARVERLPQAGEIVHADEVWEETGGGGAVAAVQLAKLAGECTLVTVLGADELGRRVREQLEGQGVTVLAAARGATRRAFVHLDEAGERTITVLGDKLRPRAKDVELDWRAFDAVDFVSGDPELLRAVRRARVVSATARELPTLREAAVELDVLIGSGKDDGERYHAGELEPPPKLVVTTAGALGGWAQPGGPFTAAEPPGPIEDTYGCGDSFAAGLVFALARGDEQADALAFAARCGAAVLSGRGPYTSQLRLA
jgi:ribokinase